MFRYIMKRIIGIIPVLFCVSVVVFIITRVIPGDPAAVMLGPEASPEAIAAYREQIGLTDPLLIQYGRFLWDLLHLDLGTSLAHNRPVFDLLMQTLPNTILLSASALVIALLVAIPVGIISAKKQNSIFDYVCMTGALMGVSMPVFWLGLMLVLLFSVQLGWLPAIGMGRTSKGIGDVLIHLILPSITLATVPMANFARITRSSMLEVIKQDYVRTARAKGLSEFVVTCKHALKNAMVPILTVMGMQVSSLLSGSVLTETIFAWPGMGRLIVDAIDQRDFVLVQGGVMFLAFMFVFVNLVIDILYVVVNPRITFEEGGDK